MTWNDFYQRQHAIQAALDHVRDHGADGLTVEAVPRASAVFSDSAELFNALQHKWSQVLTGRIGVALADAEDDPHGDRVQAVTAAWRKAAADNPLLREILGANASNPHSPTRAAIEHEQRLLALSSGLAEPHESAEEIARVGAAFMSLLEAAPRQDARTTTRRRKNPLSQLRKLIPSI